MKQSQWEREQDAILAAGDLQMEAQDALVEVLKRRYGSSNCENARIFPGIEDVIFCTELMEYVEDRECRECDIYQPISWEIEE